MSNTEGGVNFYLLDDLIRDATNASPFFAIDNFPANRMHIMYATIQVSFALTIFRDNTLICGMRPGGLTVWDYTWTGPSGALEEAWDEMERSFTRTADGCKMM